MSDPGSSSSQGDRPNKRAHPSSNDVDERVVEKRSRQEDRPSNTVPVQSRRENDTGILATMANRFTHPAPLLETSYIVVNTVNYAAYFASLYNSIVTVLYPDSSQVVARMITPDHFVLVCRYLMYARIHHVFSSITGRRLPHRVPVPGDLLVPKALADVINSIGTISIESHAYTVVPRPEPTPEDAAVGIHALVTHDMLTKFATLVHAASSRSFLTTCGLSRVCTGTAYWLLSARSLPNIENVAVEQDRLMVVSGFPEYTLSDMLLCALTQNHFDGLLPDHITTMKWTSDTVTGVMNMRESFNLNA